MLEASTITVFCWPFPQRNLVFISCFFNLSISEMIPGKLVLIAHYCLIRAQWEEMQNARSFSPVPLVDTINQKAFRSNIEKASAFFLWNFPASPEGYTCVINFFSRSNNWKEVLLREEMRPYRLAGPCSNPVSYNPHCLKGGTSEWMYFNLKPAGWFFSIMCRDING